MQMSLVCEWMASSCSKDLPDNLEPPQPAWRAAIGSHSHFHCVLSGFSLQRTSSSSGALNNVRSRQVTMNVRVTSCFVCQNKGASLSHLRCLKRVICTTIDLLVLFFWRYCYDVAAWLGCYWPSAKNRWLTHFDELNSEIKHFHPIPLSLVPLSRKCALTRPALEIKEHLFLHSPRSVTQVSNWFCPLRPYFWPPPKHMEDTANNQF